MKGVFGSNAAELYRNVLTMILNKGEMTHPRKFNCLEVAPMETVLLYPQNNILTTPERKANPGFMAGEFFWIISGRKDVEMVSAYNKKIADYSDDGKTFFGAYGPKVLPQLEYVVKTLENDPWSRQALINIWRESPPPTKDVPCTVMFHFTRRPLDKLNMFVYMRSQDAWLGLPYDLHNFTSIQLLVANMLNIGIGTFRQVTQSLHLYDTHLEQAKQLLDAINPDVFDATPVPTTVTSWDEFFRQLTIAADTERRHRENAPLDVLKEFPLDPFWKQKLTMMGDYLRRKRESNPSA